MIVALIGAGHIADALAQGWRRPSVAEPPSLHRLRRRDRARRASRRAAGGGRAATSAAEVVAAADVVVLAVRPEDVEGVLADDRARARRRARSSRWPPASAWRGSWPLCPPAPRLHGSCPTWRPPWGSACSSSCPARSAGEQVATVRSAVPVGGHGRRRWTEERFDAATAVAGCMPGMLASLVDDFAAAAEAHGIEPAAARLLAVEGVPAPRR